MGLLRTLILFDFGFCLAFGIEDLFFFFCNSRPMVEKGQTVMRRCLARVEFSVGFGALSNTRLELTSAPGKA